MKNHSVIEHNLDGPYEQPMTLGSSNELRNKIIKSRDNYPEISSLLLRCLEVNNHITLLEDWLFILPNRLIWIDNKSQKEIKDLEWFEILFKKSISINPEAVNLWLKEFIQKCPDTNYLYSRFYEYLLHIYGMLIAEKRGFNSIYFPERGRGVDIEAKHKGKSVAIECKFVKTSKKFESYCSRLMNMYSYLGKKMPPSVTLFTFPKSNHFKSLNKKDLDAIKKFLMLVSNKPEISHVGSYNSKHNGKEYPLQIRYDPYLPPATIPIENQQDFARELAHPAKKALSLTIENAIKQFEIKEAYKDYIRYILIGVQWDYEFTGPWTEQEAQKIKRECIESYNKQDFHLIFSEDYEFSVESYL